MKTGAATGRTFVLAGLLALACGLAWAVPTSSKFESTAQLDSTTLQLNGAGTRLIDIFSGQTKLNPGDSFAMDFVPGKGTTFYISGKPQGAPVGDAEFFGMVLNIWVGSTPVDATLKEALLGLDKGK